MEVSTLHSPTQISRVDSATPPPRRGWLRATVLGFILIEGVLLGLFIAGFFLFAAHVADIEPSADVRADGIVVLTGGRERVSGALDLLEQGRARRLLISGVHPATTARQIMRLTESRQALFACCIDLDRRAKDTIGNAEESRKWAERHGFKTLIVVTSAYHMPRGILELKSAMPEMEFLSHPVIAAELNLPHWYAKPATVRLLLQEYVKYIVAWLRTGVTPAPRPMPLSASSAKP